MKAVAVGDINQSIFGYANKHAKYLNALTTHKRFRRHMLTANHRSHVAITNYAARLLWDAFPPVPNDAHRVHFRRVIGDESDIGCWIGDVLSSVISHYSVISPNQIGILVKSKQTIALVSKGLANRGVSHRIREDTPLDRDTSLWASLFRSLLSWTLSADPSKYEVIDRYLDVTTSRSAARRLSSSLKELEISLRQSTLDLDIKRDRFIAIASSLMPSAENRGAVGSLVGILGSQDALASYAPISANEIHLMTIHKSKGLEFDVVFHLDLYEHILPQYGGTFEQCLNLHYVGITRARKACFLVSSTQRHKRQDGSLLDANPSPFLFRHGLDVLRESKDVTPMVAGSFSPQSGLDGRIAEQA
jgi:DNA helicase-2/ATP-dependent DNA helicase PcrA